MSNIPEWIEQLKQGEFLIIVFPYTGDTVYAEVLENNPKSTNSIYFGTITVQYTINKLTRQDDLLYDDYSKESNTHDSWHAYRVT